MKAAISHDKVEIYFYEADKINAENVAYQIHYDGAEYPIFVPGNALSPSADSRLMYTIDGLVPNREYYFEVQFLNLLTKQFPQARRKKLLKLFIIGRPIFMEWSQLFINLDQMEQIL